MVSFAILPRVAFFIALLLTPVVRNFAIGRGWVDTPDHGQVGARKLHRLPISRLGGVAIFAAYAISFVLLINSPLNGARILDHQLGLVARIAPAVLLIFVVGLFDDIFGMRAWQKLVGQLAAAGAAHAAGVTLHAIGGYPLLGWAELPATLIWLVVMTNAINVNDGMDGLATGVGLFAALNMLTVELLAGNVPLARATVPLAGALLGFPR